MSEMINRQEQQLFNNPLSPVNKETKKKKPLIWIFLSILFFLTTITLSYLLLNQKQEVSNEEVTEKEAIEEIDNKEVEEKTTWKNVNISGLLFKYPFGWHVAKFFPDDINDSLLTVFNQDIIIEDLGSCAPLGDIVFYDKFIKDSENAPQNYINEIKKSYYKINSEFKEEILDTEVGKFYHYTGNAFNEMQGEYSFEEYFFIKENSVLNITNNKMENSNLLKEIVLSVKNI